MISIPLGMKIRVARQKHGGPITHWFRKSKYSIHPGSIRIWKKKFYWLSSRGVVLEISRRVKRAVFTNEWDLASLEYSQETEGPYCTDLLTLNDIRRLLELERCRGFGNISSSINNELLDIVEQVMRPLALRQTRRPQSDRGKAHRSVSSSSSHHQGTSSYQHDDDDDDDDIETSEPSTLISPYHLILTLLIHSTTKTFSYASPLLSERELSLHDKTNCSTNATNA
ncbi:hypothetical protein Tco_1023110 [Tanacetum coccineum]